MLKKFCVFLGVGVALAVGPANATTLDMIVSWPESNTMAFLPGKQLKENLEAMDVGLEINISGPETVPPFEQVGPTSAGVFDMIYTHPAYHDRAITNVTNILRPEMDLIRSSGVFDYMDEYMQENHNLKLLANVAIGTAGYHCYLREPLSEEGLVGTTDSRRSDLRSSHRGAGWRRLEHRHGRGLLRARTGRGRRCLRAAERAARHPAL